MRHWTLPNGNLSSSFPIWNLKSRASWNAASNTPQWFTRTFILTPHFESGDSHSHKCGIEHFLTVISAVRCPIRHQETPMSANAALTSPQWPNQLINAPFRIWRAWLFQMRHWTISNGNISSSFPIKNLKSLASSNAALKTSQWVTMTFKAPFWIWRL